MLRADAADVPLRDTAARVPQGWWQPAITDEAQAVEALGVKPRLVLGSPANIKLTYAEDLALAEAILARRAHP